MKQTIGIILIIAAIFFSIVGISKLDESQQTGNFLGIFKFSVEDESTKEVGYICLGVAAVCLIGGVLSMRDK
ncbi:MAG TPA: hypothetical protein VMZ69_02715 [Saprospiraceae bacterium]|nr:hypothetical protein [Saprospiraceae bacterium]